MSGYLDDLYREIYESEHVQLDRLSSTETFLAGIAAALAGAGYYSLEVWDFIGGWSALKYECSVQSCVTIVFLLLAGVYFVLLIAAVYYIARSIWPKNKAMMGPLDEWSDFARKSQAYYDYTSPGKSASQTDADCANTRRSQYVAAGNVNRQLVILKSDRQAYAKRYLIICVVIALLNAIPYSFMKRLADERSKQQEAERLVTAVEATAKARAANDPNTP